ncbi:hypothetical protein ALC56_14992, partial [Trachymyrmex septentrionalis]
FPDKWIGKYNPINYSPRSPDLTGFDEDLVYRERPTTRDQEILRAINCFQNRIDA